MTNNKKKIAQRANLILEIAQRMASKIPDEQHSRSVISHLENIRLYFALDDEHSPYVEPGYSSESGIVALANWNEVDTYDSLLKIRVPVSNLPERVGDLFEKMGVECEWSDEWTNCENCDRLVRTSGDSYSWQPSFYILNDCEVMCFQCIMEDPTDYLNELEGDPHKCVTFDDLDLTKYGYHKLNQDSYETGWHPGQNDSPKTITKEMVARGINKFLFRLDENSQFYSRWSVYVHEDEAHLLKDEGEEDEENDEEDEDE